MTTQPFVLIVLQCVCYNESDLWTLNYNESNTFHRSKAGKWYNDRKWELNSCAHLLYNEMVGHRYLLSTFVWLCQRSIILQCNKSMMCSTGLHIAIFLLYAHCFSVPLSVQTYIKPSLISCYTNICNKPVTNRCSISQLAYSVLANWLSL
jgi:hypothetical protein